jgi:hypothetical protein
VEVRAGEQRIVVEHLLEVGDDPLRVDAVAREAAADLVVHAARSHPPQRVQRHLALAPAQEELDDRRGGKLRRAAPPAVLAVVGPAEGGHRAVERRRIELGFGRLQVGGALQASDDAGRRALDLLALLPPRPGDPLEQLAPSRHPLARLRRVVGARVERDAFRRDEGVQRPAAVAGHRLQRVHVDRVDVGTLLPVDLDRHEVLVHDGRHGGILEGLALHHVTPVARRIADRDDHRLVLGARPRERLVAPREPVHRIVLVLEQVRRSLVGEAVRHGR